MGAGRQKPDLALPSSACSRADAKIEALEPGVEPGSPANSQKGDRRTS